MEYKKLGRSDLNVSTIGFGCMSLKGKDDKNIRILHTAIDLGINFFDTADLYEKGLNEEMLGKALKEKRQAIILATKVGNQWNADGETWSWNARKEYILESVENSLRRLNTDYLDLYQLHGGTMDDDIDGVIEAFERLKQQGKIRHYGISSIRPAVISEYVRRSSIVSVMMQYSLLDRRPEDACLDLLKENEIGVLARGPLAQGLLTGKPPRPYLERSEDEINKIAAAVRFVAGEKRSPGRTALYYVLRHPAVTTAVTGIKTMQQLEDSANLYLSPDLSGAEYAFLKEALKPNYYKI